MKIICAKEQITLDSVPIDEYTSQLNEVIGIVKSKGAESITVQVDYQTTTILGWREETEEEIAKRIESTIATGKTKIEYHLAEIVKTTNQINSLKEGK